MKSASKKIHWWEDSLNRITCHENIPGAMFEQSYLGQVVKKSGTWFYNVSGSDEFVGPFDDVRKAKNQLQDAVGGEPISIWD